MTKTEKTPKMSLKACFLVECGAAFIKTNPGKNPEAAFDAFMEEFKAAAERKSKPDWMLGWLERDIRLGVDVLGIGVKKLLDEYDLKTRVPKVAVLGPHIKNEYVDGLAPKGERSYAGRRAEFREPD